jgi:NarL family two-component system sensor histidine kinase LiaS
VSALLVVVLILGGLLFSRVLVPLDVLNTASSPSAWIQLVRNDAPNFWRHVLSQEPIDTDLIDFILKEGELQVTFFDLLQVGDLELRIGSVGKASSLILDSKGRLLGTSDSNFVSPAAVGQPLDTEILPGLEGPLNAALLGDLNADKLFVTLEPNEQFYFAVPLVDESGQNVLGVAIVYVEHLPSEDDLSSNLLTLLGRSALILLASAGLVGLYFGFLTARGMVSRLQHASDVTDAWSRGDFSEFIEDHLNDEIGKLGQRLNRMALQLKDLLKRREEIAVVEERNRLARDLHDSAKQQALAASFQLGTALTLHERDPKTARSHLQEAVRLVDGVREELTDLIMELRPQNLEEKSIIEILSEYAIDWSHQQNLELELDISSEFTLSIGSKQTLFRILQEALANIVRHSGSTRVSIGLKSDGDEVSLVVKDNGKGFALDEVTHGIGLNSMQERAESLGGSMVLTSVPEEGTSISVRIPQTE